MQLLYVVLKVLHVLSVVIWIGGTTALGAITAMLVRARDRATLTALLPRIQRYGHTVGGSASMLTLVSGVGMLRASGGALRGVWIPLGLIGIAVHFAFAMLVLRKRSVSLQRALADSSVDDRQLTAAGNALRRANIVYLLLMASVIVVMVYKPAG